MLRLLPTRATNLAGSAPVLGQARQWVEMGAIHIFHAADARDFACRAASQLAAEGYSVRRLEAGAATACDEPAAAVLVVWSAQFTVTGAHGEALRRALAGRVLAPISIGAIKPPPAYAHLWPIDLTGWAGDANDPRWQFVRDEIALARLREPPHAVPAAETGSQESARAAMRSRPRRATFLTRMIPPAAAGVSVLSATAVLMATPQTMAPPGSQYRNTAPPQNESPFIARAAADIETTPPAVQPDRELHSGAENIATESVLNVKGPAPESPAFVDAPPREEMAPEFEADEVEKSAMASVEAPLEALSERYAEAASEPASETAVEDTEGAPVAEVPEILQPAPLQPPAPDDYAGVVFRDCLDCPDMTEIPAGAFQMGSTLNDEGAVEAETPVRTVTISRPFALSRREISFDDWDKCVVDGGCRAYTPSDAGWGRGARPVINVSWEDAQSYTAWLAAKTGHLYRLPSEAEWEYAAGASRQAAIASDGVISPMLVNFEDGARASTAPTASFAPSAFGLYDMLGNVWEWVADCWRDSHAGAPVDGSAIAGACETRVLKGGAFNSSAWRMRPAHRIAKNGAARESDNGFRVARDLP